MKMLTTLLICCFTPLLFGQEIAQRITDKEVNNGAYLGYKYVHVIPSNLNQCLVSLSCLTPSTLDDFSSRSLEKALEKGLFNKNNRLRMNWKLELESAPLTQYFYRHQVYHHNTMETIILWTLYDDLNGHKINLKKIIRKSKKRHKNLEKETKKKLKKAYKKGFKQSKELPKNQQERKLPPKNFEEWIFTY